MMERGRVVHLTKRQRERAAEALASAFLHDPMWSVVLPDEATRADAFRPMWKALIDFTRVYGEVYTTDGVEGAACWVAPGNTKMSVWKMLRTGFGLPRSMMRLPEDARQRFFGMMRFIDKHHGELMTGPHWYLWVLGVAPENQRRGIGSRLMAPTLQRAVEEGIPCYLETQTEGNVAFYRNLGFDVLREEREPVGDLPIWFMARRPERAE